MGKAALARKSAQKNVAKIYKDSGFVEGKSGSDTVRLWENYREQALLWRALALLQIPATALACLIALIMWWNKVTVLNVPAKPLPGFYAINEIPDEEFVSVATEFVNLIATYQSTTARRQFDEASKYLMEPMLTHFATEMQDKEIRAIENTRRTQLYFMDPTETKIIRDEESGFIQVYFQGERQKIIAGKPLPEVITQFLVTLQTIPRNSMNQYGIVITNIETTTTQV